MYYQTSIIDILLEECLMYLRKSRSDDPNLTVEEVLHNHEQELDEWCEKNLGGKIDEKQRFKEVVSGEKISERPELQKILREIEKPNIKYIITNEPSRLSRGYLDEIGYLVKLLRYNKITVITPFKIYNLEDKYDRENFERELKQGNEYLEYFKFIQKRGKDIKISNGEYIGAVRPFGYDKISYKEGRRTIRTLAIREDEAEIVRMMFRWYAYEGVSIYGIAKRLNDMGIKNGNGNKWDANNGLKELLRSPLYIGKIRWGYQKNVTTVENQKLITRKLKQKQCIVKEGLHDAIIDEETFQKALEERGKHVPKKVSTQLVNPFASIVRCKACGKSLQLIRDKHHIRLICPNTSDCTSAGLLLHELTDAVCKVLEQSIDDFTISVNNSNEDVIAEHQKQIDLLKKKLQTLEQTEIAQWEAQMNPDVSQRMPQHIFKQLNEKVLKDKEDVKNTLEKMISSAPKKVDFEQKIYTFKNAIEYLKDDEVDVEIKNAYLKDIIEKITVYRDKAVRLNRAEAEKRGIPFQHRVPCWYKPPFEMEIRFRE